MDSITRNHIFMENIDLINRTLRLHRFLLYALHLELEDVYQELAITALQAIDSYDDRRCDSVAVHIWAELQYEILNLKRRCSPLTMMDHERRVAAGLYRVRAEDFGFLPVTAINSDADLIREKEPQERRAVLDYLDGMKPTRKPVKDSFDAALEKLRDYYLSAYAAAQVQL